MRIQILIVALVCGWTAGPGRVYGEASQPLVVPGYASPSEKVPVTVEGFSPEVRSELEFDLGIQGFAILSKDQAKLVITGTSQGHLEGRVLEAGSRNQLLGRSYRNGSLRAQAHAFADDVISAITGRRGISRTRIAFKVDLGSYNEIYVADYDGHNASAVTQDHTLAFSPAWAPGGNVLYYTSYMLGNPDIFSHDLRTGRRRVVARYTGSNLAPAVSPDGHRLAMILSKDGSPDLFVSDRSGGHLRRLTSTKELESSPCWSPDSRTICFGSDRSGASRLYTISADGGRMHRLPTIGVFSAYEPSWSPDGKTIAFTTQRGGGVFELCLVPAGGGDVETLVRGEDGSWAPNSRNLIFTRRLGSRRVLSLLDVPTKEVKDVARVTGNSSQPDWAR